MLLITGESPPPPERVFIGGLGYCGSRIAESIFESYPNCVISGSVRSKERRDALLSSSPPWLTGSVHVLDLDEKYSGLLGGGDGEEHCTGLSDLMAATHIIQTIAPIADFDRDPFLALHGDLLTSSTALEYVAYLSSTGVYGDHGGDWVTEESELRCLDSKSKARVVAEREWMQLEQAAEDAQGVSVGPRVDCFRCGGIYGPGRGPLFSSVESLNEALTSEEAVSVAEETTNTKYVNRILVDDISGAILASISNERQRCGGRAYNLVDDDPAPRRAVVSEAKRLLSRNLSDGDASSSGGKESTMISAKATRNTRKRKTRATGNKRCRNQLLKDEYGWKLHAPTFREGLAILLEHSDLKCTTF